MQSLPSSPKPDQPAPSLPPSTSDSTKGEWTPQVLVQRPGEILGICFARGNKIAVRARLQVDVFDHLSTNIASFHLRQDLFTLGTFYLGPMWNEDASLLAAHSPIHIEIFSQVCSSLSSHGGSQFQSILA